MKYFIRTLISAAFILLFSGCQSTFSPKVETDICLIDPMVKITTIPVKFDKKEVMTKLSEDVARDTGLDINMVTYYWQTFDEIVCPGASQAGLKDIAFVDLYVPGFMTYKQIKKVMNAIADSLAKNTPYTTKEMFIHTHVAELGRVYIMGKVTENWAEVGGPDTSVESK
jgi:hypothetical protein